ncbi:hypothetical protein ACFYXF_29005 [Streptomyces sp. NPDC002680]
MKTSEARGERGLESSLEMAFDAEGVAVEVNEMVLDSAAYVLEYGFEA